MFLIRFYDIFFSSSVFGIKMVSLFTYVFSITSQKSTQYILSRLSLVDFNITRPELILAFQNSLHVVLNHV